MANEPLFPYYWTGLRDPRPTAAAGATDVIEVHESEWRKIVQKHFGSSREPWRDTLSRPILDALVSNPVREAIQAALETVRNQCAASLRQPLVILYSCLGSGVHGQGHRWLLLLPCGAVAIVWAERSANRLKTCYFTGAVAVKPNEKRWRHALRQQVQEYAVFDEQAHVYRYPAADDRREVSVVGAASELRYAIQFNAAEAWGFASNEASAVWRLPNWNWPEPSAAAVHPPKP